MTPLQELMMRMESKRGQDSMQHKPAPLRPDQLKGRDALTDWAIGVGERGTNPLQAMANYSQEFQNMEPMDQGLSILGGGMAGTFAGVGAKTADMVKLSLAKKMKELGKPDQDIHKATGWFFGSADGKPRFEIPDDASFMRGSNIVKNPTQIEIANQYLWGKGIPKHRDVGSASSLVPEQLKQEALQYAKMKAGQTPPKSIPIRGAISHPKLFETYPDLVDTRFSHEPSWNSRGSFDPNTNTITSGGGNILGDMTDTRSTTLHELQHAIQQREGFAMGGSPDSVLDDLRKSAPELYASYAKDNKLGELGYNRYRRLAGEAEARLTQSRMNMTGAQRAASYPVDQMDVPVSQQIVKYGDGQAMSVPAKTKYELAHEVAQRNAAKPVSEGGLGLPANNMPLDRANAPGMYPVDAYHGTNAVIKQFDQSLSDSRRGTGTPSGAIVASSNPESASTYAGEIPLEWSSSYKDGGNVMPLRISKGNSLIMNAAQDGYTPNWKEIYNKKYPKIETTNDFAALALQKKKDSAVIKNVKDNATSSGSEGDTTFLFNPANIRSRFAAFDPMRRHEADLLGNIDPQLLKILAGGSAAGLLGTAGYSSLQNREGQ